MYTLFSGNLVYNLKKFSDWGTYYAVIITLINCWKIQDRKRQSDVTLKLEKKKIGKDVHNSKEMFCPVYSVTQIFLFVCSHSTN